MIYAYPRTDYNDVRLAPRSVCLDPAATDVMPERLAELARAMRPARSDQRGAR